MTQQHKDEDHSEIEETQITSREGLVGNAANSILAMQTGVPPALQKSLGKVLGRLMTELVQYPVTKVQNAIRERKAESDARISIIEASGVQIVNQMEVHPAFVVAAAQKYSERIVRSQLNLNSITSKAAEDLKSWSLPFESEDVPEVEDDWLNTFETEASQMSSEHAQRIFAKILAGEIRQPKTFSMRTVKLMAQLDNKPAELFTKLCSLSSTMLSGMPKNIIDSRVICVSGKADSNGLRGFGLSFDELNILFEYGLVIGDYDSYMPYNACILEDGKVSATFEFQGVEYILRSKGSATKVEEFRVPGVALTRAGRELLGIVTKDKDENYSIKLNEYFASRGYEMCPLSPA